MKAKIEYFNLGKVFNYVITAKDRATGKGKEIVRLLKRLKIPKSKALMVGDSYLFDYLSARKVGVDAYLIETDYNMDYRLKRKN
jgi:phosphoglycolate phosphatase-like HAD superfamily hydrolase